MNRLAFAATLLALTLAPCVRSAPDASPAATSPDATTDLGQDLRYLRVHQLADALAPLEKLLPQNAPLVLDLRYATATTADAPAFAASFARRTDATLLLVLVSPQTPANLVPALTKLPAGALTIGVAESLPAPVVAVQQPADADRRAFDALDGGMPLGTLISGKIDKERFDEASLVKEFENGNPNAAPPPEPDPTKPAPEKAPVLTDRVLQRAVHLHRALAALKHG